MAKLEQTKLYKCLQDRNESTYLEKLDLLSKYLENEYTKLGKYFDDYTKHDWDHTISVLEYMYDMAIVNYKDISSEILMIMVYCALLHDIGMAFDENEVSALPGINSSMHKEQIREYLRKHHGKLATVKIQDLKQKEKCKKIFCVSEGGVDDDCDYSNIVAKICESHTESLRWLQKEFINNDRAFYVACLLRLADLLDVDGKRSDYYYQESRKVIGESLDHFIFNRAFGGKQKISCTAIPCDPNCPRKELGCSKKEQIVCFNITIPVDLDVASEGRIRRMISDYKDEVEWEIRCVEDTLSNKQECYHVALSPLVQEFYTPNRTASDLIITTYKIRIDYLAIKNLLLSNQLYPDPLYGIREIIQNCYDACKLFASSPVEKRSWNPEIIIRYNPTNKTISFIDNGIGMDTFVIKEYLLNIGTSIYGLDNDSILDIVPTDHIGFYGLGFYAVFMLVNKATIITKSIDDNKTTVEIDKTLSYATVSTSSEAIEHGTEVRLNLSEIKRVLNCDTEDQCCDLICDYIKNTFLFDEISLVYEVVNGNREEINLPSISITGKNNYLCPYLDKINVSVNINNRDLSSIFIAEVINGRNTLNSISYNDLLMLLQKSFQTSRIIPYMNLGEFQIFSNSCSICDGWDKITKNTGPRINYTFSSNIGGGIEESIREFCQKNDFSMPTHCDIMTLNLVIKGRNVALCNKNVICSKHFDNMLKFDACGEPPLEDIIYLRDVALPKVHVTIPWLNYRYQFFELIANIKTENVFPVLTRDDFTKEQKKYLDYAFGYALSSFDRNNDIENTENQLIKDEFYSEMGNNMFIRK